MNNISTDLANWSQVITAFVASIALFVSLWQYFKNKSEEKSSAAKVIIGEIRNAEEKLDELKRQIGDNDLVPSDFPKVFIGNSWKRYSHLFVSFLDQDEYRLITKFYENCEAIQEFLDKQTSFFWITTEHRAKLWEEFQLGSFNLQITKGSSGQKPEEDIKKETKDVLDFFQKNSRTYTPVKIDNKVKQILLEIRYVSTTSAWVLLKKTAKP